MSKAEKLEALVRKALEGDRSGFVCPIPLDETTEYAYAEGLVDITSKSPYRRWCFGLYNKDFAIALFGEEGKKPAEQDWPFSEMWEQHLALAVISKDPIEYMYKAVFDDS